ncbi:hypothetical protein BJ508DRAFT_372527 [Ascobolus immersus RN42]|uniref:Enterotoxin n=1 Tax=Ascobolus immersus RN42 TaxID=1160509 RepID=A0A3N4IKW1_ASCIM|nr:hypothetical protein BJ508DRAFT_372527 [Ascobolus immersus RN42]
MPSKTFLFAVLVVSTAPGLHGSPVATKTLTALPVHASPEKHYEAHLKKNFDPFIADKGATGMEKIQVPEDPCAHKRLDAKFMEKTGFKTPYEAVLAGVPLPDFPDDYKSCHMIAGSKNWPSKPPEGPWYVRYPTAAYDWFKKSLDFVDTVTPGNHPMRLDANGFWDDVTNKAQNVIGFSTDPNWVPDSMRLRNHPSAQFHLRNIRAGRKGTRPPDSNYVWKDGHLYKYTPRRLPGYPDPNGVPVGTTDPAVGTTEIVEEEEIVEEVPPVSEKEEAGLGSSHPSLLSFISRAPPTPDQANSQEDPPPGSRYFTSNEDFEINLSSSTNFFPGINGDPKGEPKLPPPELMDESKVPSWKPVPQIIDLPAAHTAPTPPRDEEGNPIFTVPQDAWDPLPQPQDEDLAFDDSSHDPMLPPPPPPPTPHEVPDEQPAPTVGQPVHPSQVGEHYRHYTPGAYVRKYAKENGPTPEFDESHESVDVRLQEQLAAPGPGGVFHPQPGSVHRTLSYGKNDIQPRPTEAPFWPGPPGTFFERPKEGVWANAVEFRLPKQRTEEELAREEEYLLNVYNEPLTPDLIDIAKTVTGENHDLNDSVDTVVPASKPVPRPDQVPPPQPKKYVAPYVSDEERAARDRKDVEEALKVMGPSTGMPEVQTRQDIENRQAEARRAEEARRQAAHDEELEDARRAEIQQLWDAALQSSPEAEEAYRRQEAEEARWAEEARHNAILDEEDRDDARQVEFYRMWLQTMDVPPEDERYQIGPPGTYREAREEARRAEESRRVEEARRAEEARQAEAARQERESTPEARPRAYRDEQVLLNLITEYPKKFSVEKVDRWLARWLSAGAEFEEIPEYKDKVMRLAEKELEEEARVLGEPKYLVRGARPRFPMSDPGKSPEWFNIENEEWEDPETPEDRESPDPIYRGTAPPHPPPPSPEPAPAPAPAQAPAPAPAPAPPPARRQPARNAVADHYQTAVNVGKFLPSWLGGKKKDPKADKS